MAAVPPICLLGIRFLLAALLLAIVLRKQVFPLTRQSISSGFITGLGFGVGSALLYLALPHVRAGKLTFLIALEVAIVPIVSAILYKHRLTRVEWLALVPAVVGLWLISGDSSGPFSPWEIVALASAFAYSAYTIALSRPALTASVPSRTFVSCAIVGVIASLVSPIVESGQSVRWSSYAIVSLLYLVLIGTVVRFLLQAWAQRSVSAPFTALTFSAEPVFAITLSSIFLGERFTFSQTLGALSILGAVVLANYPALAQLRSRA